MKKTILILSMILTASQLAGCASVGKEVTQDQLSGFKQGETTEKDVVSKLGEPNTVNVASDGKRTLIYIYAHSQVRASTFIPIVGIFAGGSDTRSSAVNFVFNVDGKLISYNSSQSNLGASTGLAAGQ